MGAFLEKPKTEKVYDQGSGNDISYGCCSMQGWRISMEDAHAVSLSLPGQLKAWSYFGIFDGHAGDSVSHLCSESLLKSILNTSEFLQLQEDSSVHQDEQLIKEGIVKGFLDFDKDLDCRREKSGSTAVVAFITPTHIILCNCGDSRGIIIRDDKVVLYTDDHKPTNQEESSRILAAGGQIIVGRVNGALAVSRSLGDFEYKRCPTSKPTQQLVSPEPDVLFYERHKDEDQVMVLACDGIWDVYSNYDVTEYILHRLKCVKSLSDVAAELLDTCLHKGSHDNMSVMLISLDKAPHHDASLSDKDVKLNTRICDAVDCLLRTTEIDNITIENVCNEIEKLNFEDYPPGGFVTKRTIVETMFNTFNGSKNKSEEAI